MQTKLRGQGTSSTYYVRYNYPVINQMGMGDTVVVAMKAKRTLLPAEITNAVTWLFSYIRLV
jgi:hypothetical protein